MTNTKTFQNYEQLTVSSRQNLPAAPYPRKHVHCAFDTLEDAVQAVKVLRAAGFDAENISLMASWDFVAAVEAEPQQHRRFSEALISFFSFLDGSYEVYLREARGGRHILAVRLARYEQIMQVRDLLAANRAHHMKYIDTWTIADLSI